MAKTKIPRFEVNSGTSDSNQLDLKSINVVSKMVRVFPDVREAFADNPSKFLEEYCGINLSKLGIDPKTMPAKADILKVVDAHIDDLDINRGPLAIAVCAVVV